MDSSAVGNGGLDTSDMIAVEVAAVVAFEVNPGSCLA